MTTVTVEVLVDDFCIGMSAHLKGSTFITNTHAANYMEDMGTVKIIGPGDPNVPVSDPKVKTELDDILGLNDTPAPAVKKVVRKKAPTK